MNAAWRALADEITRWSDSGLMAEFWWRDDDAARPAAALERLLALAANTSIPLALAVVPLGADPELLAGLREPVSVLQHGTDHRNRALGREKKTEFPSSEPAEAALARLAEARKLLEAQVGQRFIPVLAPPWNRLPEPLVPRLAAAGFRGLSQYGARQSAEPSSGLRQVNTHVDVIGWRTGRGFVGEDEALAAAARHLAAKRTGMADRYEATGWLTHHAVHDLAAWMFLERLFETTLKTPGVRWLGAQELFRIS
ncbi:MAG TPA: hypothetical protein VMU46_10025 [Burkholderiales bacterium]|nr:hypothetical protein [Burkholderiales bacterium]